MAEEKEKPEETPLLPQRVLEYGRPKERERRFGMAFGVGMLAFLANAFVVWPRVMNIVRLGSPIIDWMAAAAVLGGNVWLCVYTRRETKSWGFVPGFVLIPLILIGLLVVICGKF